MAVSAASVVRGPGEIAAMVVDVTRRIFTTRFQVREFIEQAWFITSVTLMPTILVSIPFGAVISLQVGNLTGQLGAQSFAGATAVLAVVREAAPIAAALIIAGAAGSAICSDLGARKIREEIDAMEVLGVDPARGASGARHDVRGPDDQRHRDRRRHRRRLLLHRDHPGRQRRRLPELLHRPGQHHRPLHLLHQGGRLRVAGRDRRRLQGPRRRRRAERCRARGQRVGDHRVHAAVLPQRGDHGHLLPGRPPPGL